MGQITPVFGSIIPSQQQLLLANNYLAFNAGANDFVQQYLPEVYEAEVERYGNRTLNGFLRMVGAELPMTSDQVIWSEQNRLHVAYSNVTLVAATGAAGVVMTFVTGGATTVSNAIYPNDTIVVMNPATGIAVKGIVGRSDNNPALTLASITCYPFQANNWDALADQAIAPQSVNLKMFVYGSVFAKGTVGALAQGTTGGATAVAGTGKSIQPTFTQFANQPIIIKDSFQINGSDMAQIGWVEVATEDGTSGYLWYLKSESETRLRFDDYLEMAMVEIGRAHV